MPIYEFFCGACNTVFNFLSTRVNTTTVPACPRCRAELARQVSVFRTLGRERGEEGAEAGWAGMDEERMTRCLGELVAEAEQCDDDDPLKIAGLVRNFSTRAGVGLSEGMEEALALLESGTDLNGLEERLEGILGEEENSVLFVKKNLLPRLPLRPLRDETLYIL